VPQKSIVCLRAHKSYGSMHCQYLECPKRTQNIRREK
jgi:hypothetical protein